MDDKDIKKNIIDLEYQYILNAQNVWMGFIGALIITAIFLDPFPENWPSRIETLFLLIMTAFLLFIYFNKKLKNKRESINRIR